MRSELQRWGKVIPLPDEHRLFAEVYPPPLRDQDTRWAITDNSGLTPEDSDDGILWLDFDWNLMISSPDTVLLIPVKRDKDGERFATVTDASTLMILSNDLGWPIEDQHSGVIYEVNRKA